MEKVIGLFGITANPPHYGHMEVIEKAAQDLDEVWVSPVFIHPFGKKFIDYLHRVKMLEMMLKDLKATNVFLKHLDKEFFEEKNEMVYSYLLLKHQKEKEPNLTFKLIVGEDNEKIFDKFKFGQEIISEFGLYVVPDKGFHSTDIRNAIKENKEVTGTSVDVIDYMNKHNLYA